MTVSSWIRSCAFVLIPALGIGLAGCGGTDDRDEGVFEDTGESVDEAGRDTQEGIGKATRKTGDAIGDSGRDMERDADEDRAEDETPARD